MARLVSDSLRPGELLQLRGSVRDRVSGRALPNRIEFTSTNANVASVDRTTGIVSARRPGRVRIVADAGGSSMQAVDLIVRAPAPPPRVLLSAADRAAATRPAGVPAANAAARTPVTRPAATVAAATVPQRPPAAAAPRAADTRAPERAQDVVTTPAAAPVSTAPPEQRAAPVRVNVPVAPAPAPTPTREVARVSTPDEDDVRLAAERLTRDVRNGRSRSIQVTQFLGDGADHRITMLGEPAVLGANANGVRVAFAVRLTKFDGGGRPVTRIASVSMDVEKRDGAVSSSAVSISDLRRP
jgi:hypothetical protein